MTEPKLSDPIVFKYEQSHVKLLANRLALTSSKRALSWRQAAINENTDSVFSYKLDTTDLRAADQLFRTLNKPGLYDIKASVAAQPQGSSADCGMTISVGFPGQALFELAYSESQVGNFQTVNCGIPFRVLPSQIGTRLEVTVKSATINTRVRGYNYGDTAYDPGAQSGSWLDVTYLGP